MVGLKVLSICLRCMQYIHSVLQMPRLSGLLSHGRRTEGMNVD
jgi:hypothetical protein